MNALHDLTERLVEIAANCLLAEKLSLSLLLLLSDEAYLFTDYHHFEVDVLVLDGVNGSLTHDFLHDLPVLPLVVFPLLLLLFGALLNFVENELFDFDAGRTPLNVHILHLEMGELFDIFVNEQLLDVAR